MFVDHGLLRKDEGDEVEAVFGPKGQFDLNFIRVNAQQRYYDKLAGVTEPEAKRKIIGEEFIRIFEEEAKKETLLIFRSKKLNIGKVFLFFFFFFFSFLFIRYKVSLNF